MDGYDSDFRNIKTFPETQFSDESVLKSLQHKYKKRNDIKKSLKDPSPSPHSLNIADLTKSANQNSSRISISDRSYTKMIDTITKYLKINASKERTPLTITDRPFASETSDISEIFSHDFFSSNRKVNYNKTDLRTIIEETETESKINLTGKRNHRNLPDVNETPKPSSDENGSGEFSIPPPCLKTLKNSPEVYISHVNSTMEIYLRPVQSAVKSLQENGRFGEVQELKIGSYYAAKVNEKEFRVKVLNINDEIVTCLLVDTGKVEKVAKNKIALLKTHSQSRAQAVPCCLHGLEELSSSLIAKQCLVKMVEEEKVFKVKIMQGEGVPRVCLFDNGKCVNEVLVKNIYNEIRTNVSKGNIHDVILTNIEPSGICHVQIIDTLYKRWKQLIPQLDPSTIQQVEPSSLNNHSTLLIQSENSPKTYYRVRISKKIHKNLFEITFIDFGWRRTVDMEETKLHSVGSLDLVLNWLPPLAQKVRMDVPNSVVGEDFSKKLYELVEADERLEMFVTEDGFCEFFKTSGTVWPISINRLLTFQNVVDNGGRFETKSSILSLEEQEERYNRTKQHLQIIWL